MQTYAQLCKNSVRLSAACRVECDRCGAQQGRICRSPSGMPAQWVHNERILTYQYAEATKK